MRKDILFNVIKYTDQSTYLISRGRRGRDRMVVGCTTIYAIIAAYHH